MNKFMFAAATVTFAASTVASAATVNSVPGAPDPGPLAGQHYVVTFDGPNAPGYSFDGNINTATMSIGGAAEPAGDTSTFGYVSSAILPSTSTLSTPDLKSISFYWGSIDTFNTVDVLGAGGATLLTINGSMIPPADGNQMNSSTNRRVNFTAGAGETITGLRFTSTGVAFEFDSFAAGAVPEPATWALLVGGFGLVGLASRRHRMAVTAA